MNREDYSASLLFKENIGCDKISFLQDEEVGCIITLSFNKSLTEYRKTNILTYFKDCSLHLSLSEYMEKKKNSIYERVVQFCTYSYENYKNQNNGVVIPECDYIFTFQLKIHVPAPYISVPLVFAVSMIPNPLNSITSANADVLYTLFSSKSIIYPLKLNTQLTVIEPLSVKTKIINLEHSLILSLTFDCPQQMNNSISIEKILLHNQNNDLLQYNNISSEILPVIISPNELYTLPIEISKSISQLYITIIYKNKTSNFEHIYNKILNIAKSNIIKIVYNYNLLSDINIQQLTKGCVNVINNTNNPLFDVNITASVDDDDNSSDKYYFSFNSIHVERLESFVNFDIPFIFKVYNHGIYELPTLNVRIGENETESENKSIHSFSC